MLVLYPVVIFFTLGVRISHLEAVSLVPSGSGGLTFDAVVFFRTCVSFILYSLIHVCLLAYMMVPQSAPGAPRMARAFSWFAPLTFWLCSFLYFYTYADMTRYLLFSCNLRLLFFFFLKFSIFPISRYGTHVSDWIAMGVGSVGILAITLFLIRVSYLTSTCGLIISN